ncbi:MAG: type II toxin-antitoxin system VapC family toxin [Deltaproteobacteria bacterium]|nr:type II toxin-antitoxin system VapC family toxin [Deltaproteobacteria bacterium]MBK8696640.1 type II toxin-antitoxin system VapC family toxin [Deltaproteobacteria bacterium]MBP6830252.1 type II toxin-antitoxin system VapC family toxin [Deltaproteobacteria bacterium]
MIYLDTSVLVPYYAPEAGSAKAEDIVRAAPALIVSDLAVAEFHATIVRKVRMGALDGIAADKIWALFESHLADGYFDRISMTRSHATAVRLLATRSPAMIRTLDALHLAMASDAGADLATFDQRLAEAARAHGLSVLS